MINNASPAAIAMCLTNQLPRKIVQLLTYETMADENVVNDDN